MFSRDLGLKGCKPVVIELVHEALKIVGSRYDFNGSTPKSYHNVQHTEDVVEAAYLLASEAIKSEKIDNSGRDLLLIAAAYHDVEQNEGKKNEQVSANLAKKFMRQTGEFSLLDEQVVEKIIMATCVSFDKEGRMNQTAGNDYLTQLLADADLAHLGKATSIFSGRMKAYFLEISDSKKSKGEQWLDFLKMEYTFIKNHHFYTPEAEKLFPNKTDNINYVTRANVK